jgi:hypothetical protein
MGYSWGELEKKAKGRRQWRCIVDGPHLEPTGEKEEWKIKAQLVTGLDG